MTINPARSGFTEGTDYTVLYRADLTDPAVEAEQYQRLLRGELRGTEKYALLAKLNRDARALALTDPDKVGLAHCDIGGYGEVDCSSSGHHHPSSPGCILWDGTPPAREDDDDTDDDGPDRRGDR